MKRFFPLLTSVLFTVPLLITACQAPDNRNQQPAGEGIAVEGAWARPAGEGRISATYFLVTNFDDTADTLLSVSSDIAGLTEIHESYEQDGGMVGMREAEEVAIPAGSTVRFEPGGLHIMLIQLARPLQADDTFELTLHFARNGELSIPVTARH